MNTTTTLADHVSIITNAARRAWGGSAHLLDVSKRINHRDGELSLGNGWMGGDTDRLRAALGSDYTIRNSNGYVNVKISADAKRART